ncbi:IS3 family transposase [Marinobacter sp. BSs20148]|uniref:IS3 family transposase n=1 Tax=Marinobacter sp. BSs20148 TaxID=490759 RepID=UPI00117D2D83|nr:IS3 family transposase [Marinobacter sp. BSs20148]
MMSRLLGASRNAYYRYCQRQRRRPSDAEHEAMIEAVKELAQSSDKSIGPRRMNHALNALGYPVGRQKAWSLIREADVKARYRKKFKIATDSDHKQPVFDNVLAREFTAAEPDQAHVTDITYIWTREAWLNLAVFIDLFRTGSRLKHGVTDER